MSWIGLFRTYGIPLLFAPGVVIHEIAHYLACKGSDVTVNNVVFFQFGSPAGYVEHAVPRSYTKRILITMAPFLMNTAIAVALYAWSSALPPVEAFGLMVLGTIVLQSAMPSELDASGLLPHSVIGVFHPLFILSIPLIVVLFVINWLRPYGSNILFTVIVASLLFLTFHTGMIDLPTVDALREILQP